MRLDPNRRRRSLLFLPASNGRALAKAMTLPADMLVLDLEDAVPPGDKEAARGAAVAALATSVGPVPPGFVLSSVTTRSPRT